MLRRLNALVCAVGIIALLMPVHHAGAQPSTIPPGANFPPVHIAPLVTNGNLRLAWQLMPGWWQLQVQEPAETGNWKPVPPELYHTNAMTVTATLPLPEKPALYRLKRLSAFMPLTLPPMPPVPAPPTNRPPPMRPPGH